MNDMDGGSAQEAGAEVRRGIAGIVRADGPVKVDKSAAGVVVSGAAASVDMAWTGAVLASGEASLDKSAANAVVSLSGSRLHQSAAQVVATAGDVEVEYAAAGVVAAPSVTVRRGLVGLLVAGKAELAEDTRVVLRPGGAASLGAAFGIAFAVVSIIGWRSLFKRWMQWRRGDEE